MQPLISTTEAHRRIATIAPDWGVEQVPLPASPGRILAAPIVTDSDWPPYNRVMMDGIAVRYCDWFAGTRKFSLIGEISAGTADTPAAETNQAVEVATGGALSGDWDLVIPCEDIELNGDTATVCNDEIREHWQHIHRRGSDAPKGKFLLPDGKKIHAGVITQLASWGYAQVTVSRRPRIKIFATGDELVPVNTTPSPNQIRASNAHTVATLLAAAGGEIISSECIADEHRSTYTTLATALTTTDIVVTCGGISRGKKDFVHTVLTELCGDPILHGVRQRPGKPFGVWQAPNGTIIFALPGNPAAALTTARRYVAEFIRTAAGAPLPMRRGNIQDDFSRSATGEDFVYFTPGKYNCSDTVNRIEPIPTQNSGDIIALADSDGFFQWDTPARESRTALWFGWDIDGE